MFHSRATAATIGCLLSCGAPSCRPNPRASALAEPPGIASVSVGPAEGTPAPMPSATVGSGPSGSTPGLVQCGAGRAVCSLDSQICCMNPAERTGQCLPRSADAEGTGLACWDAGRFPVTMACDEAVDCPSGEACCIQDLGGDDVSAYLTECAPYPCNAIEVCLPGGTCHNPEFSCVPNADPVSWGGRCELAAPHTECGGASCAGSTPVCCWDRSKRSSRCVESADSCVVPDATANAVALRCRSGSECGGYPCAFVWLAVPGLVYACSSRWAAGAMGASILCDTAADCPTYSGRSLLGCESSAELPPWTKVCNYQWHE